LSGLKTIENGDRFRVSYAGSCDGPDGSIQYETQVAGSADGRLRFSAEYSSPKGFVTNRTGFVVLHAPDDIVGRLLEITHSGGLTSETIFPTLIRPDQPASDIIGLRYEFADGCGIALRMEGDTFEMEDQRNWTDASFKTYVRPLSRGFPYRVEPGQILKQEIALSITGQAPTHVRSKDEVISVEWGGELIGKMPQLGLYADSSILRESVPKSAALSQMKASFLHARVDLRAADAMTVLDRTGEWSALVDGHLALDVIVAGRAPAAELAALGEWLDHRMPHLDTLFIIPARDLPAHMSGDGTAGDATLREFLAEARLLLPRVRLAAGVPVGFPELNRNRPAPGFDVITHATQAIVHAADDRSVMETLSTIAHVVRSTRDFAGPVFYRIGPATIGMLSTSSASGPLANPAGRRIAMAMEDPRQKGLFAAAFMIGYVEAAAGVDALTLATPTGAFGLLDTKGARRPVAAAFEGMATLSNAPRLDVRQNGSGRLAAVAAMTSDGPVLWLANLREVPVVVNLQSAASLIRLFDADSLATVSVAEVNEVPLGNSWIRLGSYAICRIR
jgi:D-apionolactonase